MKPKTILSIVSNYVVPLVLIVVSIISPNRGTFEEMGWLSLYLIIIILYMKPLSRIFSSKRLTRWLVYRRQLGITSFWVFLFHAAGLIYVMGLWDLNLYITVPYLFWGAIGGIGMVILGLTSNDVSVRFLKRNWKRIQYVAYPTFFAALIHAGMADNEFGFVIGAAVIYIVLKILEWKGVTLRKQ